MENAGTGPASPESVAEDRPSPQRSAPLGEAIVVGALLALVALLTFVTYWRVPAEELYHTSIEGPLGGASRTLVLLNYPVALVAVAVMLLAADRLADAWDSRALAAACGGAVALCAVVAWPGVVDEADLDAKAVNALPALGVAIAVLLAVLAARRGAPLQPSPPAPGDRVRAALGVVLAVAALPWAFAEAGFYAGGPFLGREMPEGEVLAAVHLGRHHGMDGVLLAVTALLLSRTLGSFRHRLLAAAASGYLALMLLYGLANALQDFWLEQVVKRGVTGRELPGVTTPSLEPAWGAILLGAVVVHLVWFGRALRR